jgi:hypothetical protein
LLATFRPAFNFRSEGSIIVRRRYALEPWTSLSKTLVSARSVGDEKQAVEPKASFDNRSREFPSFFEEDDDDVTFGR